jgi:hypothetical protein
MDEVFKSSMKNVCEHCFEALLNIAKTGNGQLVSQVVAPVLDLALRQAGANVLADVQIVQGALNGLLSVAQAAQNAAQPQVSDDAQPSDDSVVANSATSDDAEPSESVS